MSIDLILIAAIIILGFASLFIWLQKKLSTKNSEEDIENLVNKVFVLNSQKITEQAKQALASDKEAIKTDLENKQRTIEKLVKQLQDDMSKRQDEIRTLEQDRTKKFSELTTQIEEHRKVASELKASTKQLADVLSNNQARGAWGERVIENLLSSHGLREGVEYLRQSPLGKTSLRPDITLLLPNGSKVAVDVKFPYAEIQKMAESENKEARVAHLQQFRRDLKIKISKVAEYIMPEENTLDYAILFVPNEMVFSFVNQKFPEVVDEALEKRVIIVSPFTFLIVARTVVESYRNFRLEDRLREVITHINGFTQEWVKFRGQFEKYGRAIDTLKQSYDDLTTTRFNQMQKRINKIETYHAGELEASDQATLLEEEIPE